LSFDDRGIWVVFLVNFFLNFWHFHAFLDFEGCVSETDCDERDLKWENLILSDSDCFRVFSGEQSLVKKLRRDVVFAEHVLVDVGRSYDLRNNQKWGKETDHKLLASIFFIPFQGNIVSK
jgi:hypothetical protein